MGLFIISCSLNHSYQFLFSFPFLKLILGPWNPLALSISYKLYMYSNFILQSNIKLYFNLSTNKVSSPVAHWIISSPHNFKLPIFWDSQHTDVPQILKLLITPNLLLEYVSCLTKSFFSVQKPRFGLTFCFILLYHECTTNIYFRYSFVLIKFNNVFCKKCDLDFIWDIFDWQRIVLRTGYMWLWLFHLQSLY